MSDPISTYAQRLPEQLRSVWNDAVSTAADARARLLAIEPRPLAADVVDAAVGLAAQALQAQRDAVIWVVEKAPIPASVNGWPVPSPAESVHAAYEVAGRVLEAQRQALHTLVEVAVPAPASANGSHAAKQAA